MGGWTQTPNFIYDLMPEMKEAEIKVVMAVVRQTAGWRTDRVKLRMVDLAKLTGLSHPSVNNGIKAALDRGILDRKVDGESFVYWLVEPQADAVIVKIFNNEDDKLVEEKPPESKKSEQSSVKNLNNEAVNESQELVPDSKNFEQSAVKNLNSEGVKNFNPNKRNTNTNKPKKRENRARVVSSGVRGAKKRKVTSPYLKRSKFINGFIPPGTGSNAVEVYYERFEITDNNWRLSDPLEDDLVARCKNLDLLREVVAAYHQSNFKTPRNIKLILDWYQHPERFRADHTGRNGSNGNHTSTYTPPPVAQFSMDEMNTYVDPDKDEIPY